MAAALLTGSLAACGEPVADAEDPHVLGEQPGRQLEVDKKTLAPELDKFEQQTGIKVKLEVVPWSDLLNRILAATTSGQGPDVLNIGNTWSASLQATGALLPFDADDVRPRSAARTASCRPRSAATGAAGQGPGRGAAVLDGVRALLQQEDVRRRRHRQPAGHLGRTGRRRQEAHQGRQVGPRRSRARTSRRTSTTPSSSPSSTARDFFDAAGKPHFDTPAERRRRSSSTST